MRESEGVGVEREKAGKCKFEVVNPSVAWTGVKDVHEWMQRTQVNGNAMLSMIVIMHLLDM
eukprot:3206266-Alexandrium_andersonii.AAC.1